MWHDLFAGGGKTLAAKKGKRVGWVKKDGGNWIGHWYDYSSGAQHERTHSIGPIKELSKKQAREKLAAHVKSFRPNSQMSFEAAAKTYIDLRRGRWGKNHRQSITSIFDCQINPVLGKRCVADMSPAEIQTFLNKLAEFGSESLLKKTVTHIRGVFDMLVEKRILDRNPAKSKTVYRPDTRSADKRYLELWECQVPARSGKRSRLFDPSAFVERYASAIGAVCIACERYRHS
jgi:hypothetical protein